MSHDLPPLEVLPRDLSAYRAGNTGIPYVHRFDSGRPGPHVLVVALTHGNEICGMVAACDLLDRGVRPVAGVLTVAFANVAAYESFDPAQPFESRQLVHNLNRVWSPEWLDGPEDSPELRRARELRPVVAAADHILDIHSTSLAVPPFWVYNGRPANLAATEAIGVPSVHLVMPRGIGTGTPLSAHGRHGDPGFAGVGVVVECGQHFAQASADMACRVVAGFLGHFGTVPLPAGAAGAAPAPQQRFELLQTHLVQTPHWRFVRPLVGLEVFDEGELIATDGDAGEIRAPCADCTVFMPTRQPIVGREGVYLTQPIA